MDPDAAIHLGRRIHADFSAEPAFDAVVPNDDDGTVTVYLRADDAQLRGALESAYPGQVVFEVIGKDGGWYAYRRG